MLAPWVMVMTVSPYVLSPACVLSILIVPIYDGHDHAGSHFLFRPSDFDNLTSLPHYTLYRDLDTFTLVTVGYSLGVWSSFNDQPLVGTNVLFVIMLGSTPSQSALEARNLLS